MFDALIPPLIKLTTEVGEVIMSFYKNDISVEVKSDQTPLTVVDQTAHQLIIKGLHSLTPDTPILSEESDEISFDERSKWSE
ncbi:MAG: 3'(2'),5'-bisphosphate nucleotidase, partial [Candidatus Thioglobus sp.]